VTVRGRHAELWSRAALAPPRAHGAPLPPAQLKAVPEDFRVEEQLSFVPSGSGAHWLLRVEKRNANTRWVAAQLARHGAVPGEAVGYAGLKDRRAVTVQWFSVPALAGGAERWSELRTAEFRVIEVHGNSRKLRRGALAGNRFRIRLRGTAWSREQLDLKLDALVAHGAPNYFGPQRFGRDGYNLDRVAAWVQTGEPPRVRAERGFLLSAMRSMIFNAVLARRVEAGDWSQIEPGDLATLDGSGSHFRVDAVDELLRRRASEFDIHPSGPLWGRGAPGTQGRSLQLELAAAADFPEIVALLAGEGLTQERRPLRCPVRELHVEAEAGTLALSFMLGRGQYATSVLREICELGQAAALEPDDD
jgi:tRNA pseudouridine13 synthase